MCIIDVDLFQNVTATPGEILTFYINALDGAGNWKEAVWNYYDNYKGNNVWHNYLYSQVYLII